MYMYVCIYVRMYSCILHIAWYCAGIAAWVLRRCSKALCSKPRLIFSRCSSQSDNFSLSLSLPLCLPKIIYALEHAYLRTAVLPTVRRRRQDRICAKSEKPFPYLMLSVLTHTHTWINKEKVVNWWWRQKKNVHGYDRYPVACAAYSPVLCKVYHMVPSIMMFQSNLFKSESPFLPVVFAVG